MSTPQSRLRGKSKDRPKEDWLDDDQIPKRLAHTWLIAEIALKKVGQESTPANMSIMFAGAERF